MNTYHKAVVEAFDHWYPDFQWRAVTDGSHPESWPALEAMQGGVVLINGVSDDNNLYGSAEGNTVFRAWHDAIHLDLGVGFDVRGERMVAHEQSRQLLACGVADVIAHQIQLDVIAQIEYFSVYHDFVQDQLLFLARVNYYGIEGALKQGMC